MRRSEPSLAMLSNPSLISLSSTPSTATLVADASSTRGPPDDHCLTAFTLLLQLSVYTLCSSLLLLAPAAAACWCMSLLLLLLLLLLVLL
jgi:hypothetical protein